ncbi:MAG TPA: hypothetical protein VIK96_05145 [Bacilli bacterium]
MSNTIKEIVKEFPIKSVVEDDEGRILIVYGYRQYHDKGEFLLVCKSTSASLELKGYDEIPPENVKRIC